MLHACILCTALRIMLLHRVQIVYPPFHPYSVLCPGNLAWGAERGMGSRPRYPSGWLFPHQGQGEVQHSEGVRRLAELIFWWSGIGAHGNIFVFFPGTSWDHFLWSNILAFEKKQKHFATNNVDQNFQRPMSTASGSLNMPTMGSHVMAHVYRVRWGYQV